MTGPDAATGQMAEGLLVRRAAIEQEQRAMIEKNGELLRRIGNGGWLNRRDVARYERHCRVMDALNDEWGSIERALAGPGGAGKEGKR